MSRTKWKATPVWDTVAGEHRRIQREWSQAWGAAEVALRPLQSWREATRTSGRSSKATEALIPTHRTNPARAPR